MPDLPSYLCPSAPALSARIAAERLRLDLSQREASKILGIAQPSYAQYEAGKTYLSIPTLFALIEALGMEPAALLPELFAAVDRKRIPL